MDAYLPFISYSVIEINRTEILYEHRFGKFGDGQGEINEPSGVAVTPNGDVAIIDSNNHRVQVFDSNGKFKFRFGEQGREDGQLLYPTRIAVNMNNGCFVVTERTQLQMFDKAGKFMRRFGSEVLNNPRGVAIDKKDRIVVIDCKIMGVVIFDWNGIYLSSFECNNLKYPNNVCVDDKEQIYICDNRLNCVNVFDYAGNYLRTIGSTGITSYPISVMINSNGDVVVCDNYKAFNITVFDQMGNIKKCFKSLARHYQCFDTALLSDTSLVVCSKDNRVYVYHFVESDTEAEDICENEKSTELVEQKSKVLIEQKKPKEVEDWSKLPPPKEYLSSKNKKFDISSIWASTELSPKVETSDFFNLKPKNETFGLSNSYIWQSSESKPNANNSTLLDLTPKFNQMTLESTPKQMSFSTPINRTTHMQTPITHSTRPQTLNRTGIKFDLCFGEFGTQPGQVGELSGIAVTPTGDIAVTDTTNHCIQVFDQTGGFKFSFGKHGKGDGQFVHPNRIAACPTSGCFAVTERLPSTQIQLFDNTGKFVRRFGQEVLKHPRGVAIDRDGYIAVIECKIMRVVIFDWYGNIAFSFYCVGHLHFPNNICVNNQQQVLICDNRLHAIKIFNYSGTYVRTIGGQGITHFPIGVGVDFMDDIIVCDNHKAFNITLGEVKSSFKSIAHHQQCFDLAVMPDGKVAVCSKDFHVYVYHYFEFGAIEYNTNPMLQCNQFGMLQPNGFLTPQNNIIAHPNFWNSDYQAPTNNGLNGQFQDSGFEFTPTNLMSVEPSDPFFDQEEMFSSTLPNVFRDDVKYEFFFGEYGNQSGQFTEISGIAVTPTGDIAVADTNNHRIQIFDQTGKFKFAFGEHGKGDGQFMYPNRITVSMQNGCFVISERVPSTQLQIYDEKGKFVRRFGDDILEHPRGLAVDKDDFIVVAECKIMRVVIFDWYGGVVHSFECNEHMLFPNNICTNDRHEVLISDNRLNCVKVFTYLGDYARTFGESGLTNFPIAVEIDSAGDVIVCDNHKTFNITVFDQNGNVKKCLKSDTRHHQCFDVALLPYSRLAVCSKDCRVYVYRYGDSSSDKII